MTFSRGFLLGTILGVVAVSGGVLALKSRSKDKPKKQIRGYLDLIDLTADQKHKVEQIRESFLPRVAGIRQELRSRRIHLADLLFATPPDHERIRVVVEEIAGLQLKLEQEVVEHIIEENGLLTPEQQHQFYEVITQQFRGGGLGVHDVGGRQ